MPSCGAVSAQTTCLQRRYQQDSTARIWDTYSGECLHIIGSLGDQIWCGVPGLMSQGHPESVHVYDITKEQMVSYVEIPTWMRSMARRPDGTLLAGGLENGSLFLWNPYTGVKKGLWCLGLKDYHVGLCNYWWGTVCRWEAKAAISNTRANG